MPCYFPLKGYRSKHVGASGKRPIVFNTQEGYSDLPVELPCGKCIGCRLEKSRQWAVRMVHESTLHSENCFITLTYSDEHLPADRSLDVRTFQLFMKRLRKEISPKKIRFFHCGEYGGQTWRPHYHACLFGIDFYDKELVNVTNDQNIFISPRLSNVWGLGNAYVGSLTFESAAYCARYVTKKVTGEKALTHYDLCEATTGEIFKVRPEYATMSRRPGLASAWYDKFGSDVAKHDQVIINYRPAKPPKFYDQKLAEIQPTRLEEIKKQRSKDALKRKADLTPDRLAVAEKVKQAQIKSLKRGLE